MQNIVQPDMVAKRTKAHLKEWIALHIHQSLDEYDLNYTVF